MDDNFIAALGICGIIPDQPLMEAVTIIQGISDVQTVIALSNKEFDQLAVAINKMPVAQGDNPLVLNQIKLKRMKAFRLWLIWRERRDMEPDPIEFDLVELQWGLTRMAYEERCKVAEPPEQKQPDNLEHIGFDVWTTFWRQFGAYCGTIRGAMMIPISYVFRVHSIPTDAMYLADYNDSDEELAATVKLDGPDFLHDNKMVWLILVRLVGGGSALPFVKEFETTFDARSAIAVLRTQSLGAASDFSRRSRAFRILSTTKYTGKSARFTFSQMLNEWPRISSTNKTSQNIPHQFVIVLIVQSNERHSRH
jgi:hypothetical protein